MGKSKSIPEINRKNRVSDTGLVMLSEGGAALGIIGMGLGGFWAGNYPSKPQGYDKYTQAYETFSTLSQMREEPVFLQGVLPYSSNDLQEKLGPFFAYSPEQSKSLEEAVSSVGSDIALMEQKHPEYRDYETKSLDIFGKSWRLVLPIMPGVLVMVSSDLVGLRRKRNVGINYQEEAQNTQ
ncbi:MAG: hypothetical protein AABX53_00455 [Nanoarchaeota archaeon]